MKLITLTLILLATLVIPAKEKESECNNKMIITDIIVKGKR